MKFYTGFGVAVQKQHRYELTGQEVGLPQVRSPELIMGMKRYSYAVDVWVAGCVCFSVLTGGMEMLQHSTPSQLEGFDNVQERMFRNIVNLIGTKVRTPPASDEGKFKRKFAILYNKISSYGSLSRGSLMFLRKKCKYHKSVDFVGMCCRLMYQRPLKPFLKQFIGTLDHV